VEGCCEYGDELSGSIKVGTFFDHLNDFRLLKNDSASWS
jgi:hypothetical protein